MIERQVQQLVRLMDDLLDMSRIARNKLTLRRERIELSAVVESAVEGARPFLDGRGHRLDVRLPKDPIFLDGDPTRLTQVFGNLLSNACKFTENGDHLELSAELQGNEVVVSVRDNGIGIPVEHLESIFEIFSQVPAALERTQGGLGIGLALVRWLVEMHGGRVEACSEGPGRGSTFHVRLPVVNPPPRHAGPDGVPAAVTSGETHRLGIILADDNVDAALSLSQLLIALGHEVRTVHDGQAALDLAKTWHADVMLLDIGMPKLNGYEVARRVREEPWGQGIVFIALTGWGQDEDRTARRAGGLFTTLHQARRSRRHVPVPVVREASRGLKPGSRRLVGWTPPTVFRYQPGRWAVPTRQGGRTRCRMAGESNGISAVRGDRGQASSR